MKTRVAPTDNPRDVPHVDVEPVGGADGDGRPHGPTRLEWAVRPSCLVSIVAVVIIAVLLRTRMPMPFPVMLVVAAVIWFAVLSVFLRWGAPRR